jgi:4-hydroxy-3-methylbut-2-enyl diphosphate reductase
MKQFDIPAIYRSNAIGRVKDIRKKADPRKKDFSPSRLDFGSLEVFLARHFGFCYGVENAIEISYRTLQENPGKNVFLLSQMIHNPHVNDDLHRLGVRFIHDTEGREILPLETVKSGDIVIIPAFGTTLEMEEKLRLIGALTASFNTTCPFVEKVWNRSEKIGLEGYSIIIHGKFRHEETRATFSHSSRHSKSLVILNMEEAELLARYIQGELPVDRFYMDFDGRFSAGFNPESDLDRIGVVNQTTMLASETQAIAEYLKGVMFQKYGEAEIKHRFADTRDTLCYATNDNQQATYALLETGADMAIVVGGYNSSNTSHLVELCEEKLPTYFISSASEIDSEGGIRHFNIHKGEMEYTPGFMPKKSKVRLILTSGASCPDSQVEEVLTRLLSGMASCRDSETVLQDFEKAYA